MNNGVFGQNDAVQYQNQCLLQGQNGFCDVDAKLFFAENAFEGNFQKQPYRSDEKYVDMPQYVDYSSILDAYENKMSGNERLMSDLDFRFNNLGNSSLHYGVENFGLLNQ